MLNESQRKRKFVCDLFLAEANISFKAIVEKMKAANLKPLDPGTVSALRGNLNKEIKEPWLLKNRELFYNCAKKGTRKAYEQKHGLVAGKVMAPQQRMAAHTAVHVEAKASVAPPPSQVDAFPLGLLKALEDIARILPMTTLQSLVIGKNEAGVFEVTAQEIQVKEHKFVLKSAPLASA